jgi:tRNA pseudouridine13 synthase
MENIITHLNFPKAYSPLPLSAKLRRSPADFAVTEILGFSLSGEGEHYLVCLEKTGQNTQWVAAQLAEQIGIKTHAVGYCGRKDRHAVTTQWFSLHLPGQAEPNWEKIDIEGCKILKTARHHKKFRPGMHAANAFEIRLTELNIAVDPSSTVYAQCTENTTSLLGLLKKRIDLIHNQGIPNYFGAQRFGQNGSNLIQAQRWFIENKAPRRDQRNIILSSGRAFLFNTVLAARITEGNWSHAIPGDALLEGLPAGPLWGRGRSATRDQALAIEKAALAGYLPWLDALEHKGLTQERRSFVLKPGALDYALNHDLPDLKEHTHEPKEQPGNIDATLTLKFQLCAGAFATAVLAEVLAVEDCGCHHRDKQATAAEEPLAQT